MGQLCDNCINKTQCAECDNGWKDKFIPSDEVKKYFKRYYNGVRGVDGCSSYHFDNFNQDLVSTHLIFIGNERYCPYCGNKMFSIQRHIGSDLRTIGYTCICQGARSEIKYEEKLNELKEKHKAEISELNHEYAGKLVFCADKLLQIKHEKEKRRHNFDHCKYTHMSTLNGKQYTDIDQIVR